MLSFKGRQVGQIELLILIAIVILFAFFVSGGILPKKSSTQSDVPIVVGEGKCCNTGNGEECQLTDPTIHYKGRTYRLLKSDIALSEQWFHLVETGILAENGQEIFINTTESSANHPNCGRPGEDDLFFGGRGGVCTSLPDDTIIFVCKEGCGRGSSSNQPRFGKFDAYFEDGKEIPDFIKNCDPNTSPFGGAPIGEPGGDLIECPSPDPKQSLQLENCKITKRPPSAVPWLSPYCKPAIYLYPQEKTDVIVSIAPKGKLTLAIPNYPQEGWLITANSDGVISYQNVTYEYLYYEAEVPDTLVEKPKEGFVVKYEELNKLFGDLLPKLGLNNKESSQFSDYWFKALPKSPYYFVGVVSTKNLSEIAPLTINPTPTTVIRVTLYFQALDSNQNVTAPTINPVKRDGFTVVEWGGIVKTDENHPFSCLM